MKQKRRVSMMVVLVVIISVVFVACDSAVNQHKTKTKTKDIVSQKSEFYFERKINTQTVSGVTTNSFDTITNNASMTFSKINYSDGSSTYIFSYTFYKQLHGDGAIKKTHLDWYMEAGFKNPAYSYTRKTGLEDF